MRALSSTAAVLTGLLALTTALPAQAQGKPAGKPAAAPAKPAAAPAKPAAAPAKPAAGAKIVPRAGATATATAKAPPAPKPLTDKQKKDLAKKNYKEGEASFKDGKYAEALEHYRIAEEAVPIGATKYKIAASLDKLGKVQESVAAYQVFLDSTPDAVKMKDAIADSTSRVEALKKTPGKVRVATEPSSPPNLKFAIDAAAPVPGIAVPAPVALAPAGGATATGSVSVGGTAGSAGASATAGAAAAAPGAAPAPSAAPAMAFNGEFSVPPGHHKITATADGYDATSAEVDVAFAETKDVKMALTLTPPPPPPPVVAPPPVAIVEPPPQPILPPPAKRSNVPAYVTLGLAGAGAIVGTIFGVAALGSKSDFNAPGGATVENADKTDRNALISDMSFAVALTFGVTGAVLLLSNDTPAETKAATNGAPRKPVKSAMPRGFVAPYAGPTGGGAAAFMTF